MKTTILFSFLFTLLSRAGEPQLPLESIQLPKGFKISLFASVPGARSMALSSDGTLFVGSGGMNGEHNRVYAVRDLDKDGVGESVTILADDLQSPNGVAFREGHLFVAEISRILVFKDIAKKIQKNAPFEVFHSSFPEDSHHGWKFIRFAPDGSLFVPVGAPCNNCLREQNYANLYKLSADGKTKTLVARGIRNTVGFDFHPESGDLIFTENGRDRMGDDIPACELNLIAKKEWEKPAAPLPHFGFPYCHAGKIKDPEFGAKRSCQEFRAPIMDFGAHVAPLGMRFYTGKQFPAAYRNQIFVAEHGSWNRSKRVGYRVSLARKENGRYENQVFASGWLNPDDSRWGRPVDVQVAPDGSLFVSDDLAGAIYRISYQ